MLAALAGLKSAIPVAAAIIAGVALIALALSHAAHRSTKAKLITARAQLTISNASIDSMTAAIEAQAGQARERADAWAVAKAGSKADVERFDSERQGMQSRLDALRLLSERVYADGQCEVGAKVMKELDDA